MNGRLRTSRQGLDLIKSFEGFRPAAARLPDGRFTIGYGHVRSAREGVVISERDAEDLLKYDLRGIEEAVNELAFTPLSQNQFDALASLVFNISPGQFKDSDILGRLNAGDYIGAATGFDAWRKARINGRLIVVDALVRRRAVEKALFLEPAAGRPAAPTPLVTPELDTSAGMPLTEEAVSVDAQVNGFDHDEHVDDLTRSPEEMLIAEAIRKLAERQAETAPAIIEMVRETVIVETGADEDLEEAEAEAPAAGPATPTEAARIVADRIARILARADQIGAQMEAAAVEPQAVTPEPVVEAQPQPVEPQPRDGAVDRSEEIARIRRAMAAAKVLPSAEPVEPPQPPSLESGKPGPRIFIDDTEIYDLGRDPSELFAEIEAKDAEADERPGVAKLNLKGLGAWFAVLALAVMGVVVGMIETVRQADAPGNGISGPLVVLAVFGLMMVMSLYFIASKALDPERE
jgi:lysozyme